MKSVVSVFLSILLLIGCYSSKNKREKRTIEENKVEQAPISMAPGTALVTCKIVDIFEEENNISYLVSIDSVLGYGSSTPPLAVGSEIELISNPISLSDSASYNFESLQREYKYRVELKHTQPKFGDSGNGSWIVSSKFEKTDSGTE